MKSPLLDRLSRLARAGVAVASLLPALACHGYYPSWHYVPPEEIHALHLGGDKDPDESARVGARIVGILREQDGAPRRLHARFDVDASGKQPLIFKASLTTATPSGAAALHPDTTIADVSVINGSRRDVDVFFALPDPPALENASLETIDLTWTIEIAGAAHASRGTFRRARFDDPGPGYWYGDPYWYGPPYWDDPWYWRHGYWGRASFVVVDRH